MWQCLCLHIVFCSIHEYTQQWLPPVSCRCWNIDQTLVMKKYLQLFFEQVMGSYLKKIKYIKTAQINLREWQKWHLLLILYINIVTLWCYSWESWMYSINYQALNSSGNCYNCKHTYACMLTPIMEETLTSGKYVLLFLISISLYIYIKCKKLRDDPQIS